MAHQIVICKYCTSDKVVRYGARSGHVRHRCKDCGRVFKTEHAYRAYEPGVKEQIVDMAMRRRRGHFSGSLNRQECRNVGAKKKSAEPVDANPYAGARGISVEWPCL
jgi:hypothetical protein